MLSNDAVALAIASSNGGAFTYSDDEVLHIADSYNCSVDITRQSCLKCDVGNADMYFVWYSLYGRYQKIDGAAANGWFQVSLTDGFTDAKLCVKTEFYQQHTGEPASLSTTTAGIDGSYYIDSSFWFIITGIVWKAK